ncbi:Uncharacterized protein Fot_24710 [Forsythia ovata]|uniref:Arabidopsis retrotransposon Orf1 C-terminal domain-containing protein n=1 Tax=Forsythia ovata TaxID=205694 RepID=A0ABD1U751_9LAMI
MSYTVEEYASSDEYLHSACDYIENFEPVSLYKALSTPNYYDPSKSKDSYLRDPALKYIHRFLAFTFSGRKDSAAVLCKSEFYFMWCVQNKIKVNLGFWLVSQFSTIVKNKRLLILGSLITHLAVHENLIDLDDNDLHIACEMQPLDLHCLEIMGLVWKEADAYHFHEPGPIVPRPTHTHTGTTNKERWKKFGVVLREAVYKRKKGRWKRHAKHGKSEERLASRKPDYLSFQLASIKLRRKPRLSDDDRFKKRWRLEDTIESS